MDNCNTCKHWIPGPIYNYNMPFKVGRCDNIPHENSAFEWDEDYSQKRLKADHKNKLAFAQDASGYNAWILTCEDFGCISHES